ncbi:MAG: hypothetical protein K6D97_01340 [Clostridia bacterium]|nr:hypothetical protein [Clostridia bacterium]
MHYLGTKSFLTNYRNKAGLIEGATESYVEKKYGWPNTSCYHNNSHSNLLKYARYNFSPTCGYPEQVALIRQMEHALGMESIKSILLGNDDFFNEFANRYGKDTFRVVRHCANRFLHAKKIKNPQAYLQEVQNLLLERVFDKDFSAIETIDDARKYFNKLQSFETQRVKLPDDTATFKDYYDNKLNRVKVLLQQKGYSDEEIASFNDEHKYKKQEYFPYALANKDLANFLFRSYAYNPNVREVVKNNPEKIHIMTLQRDDFSSYYLLLANDKPLSLYYYLPETPSKQELATETAQVLKERADGSKDTFIQRDGHYYIKTKDGNELCFEETDYPKQLPDADALIKRGEQELLEREEERKKLLEYQSQYQSLRKISYRQRLSNFSKVTDMIKRIFNRTKTNKNHTGKDSSTELENEGDINDR